MPYFIPYRCRDGLDGSRWPSMNPRVLRCDYASTDLFEWMKVNGDSSDLQPPKHLLLGDASSNTEISIVEADKSGLYFSIFIIDSFFLSIPFVNTYQ